jgi:hypothetical protein
MVAGGEESVFVEIWRGHILLGLSALRKRLSRKIPASSYFFREKKCSFGRIFLAAERILFFVFDQQSRPRPQRHGQEE